MPARLSDDQIAAARFLVGPTASGKSAVAMAIAAQSTRPVEIVALDSMTLYRGFDIGTAKPSADDRRRVPHHLIDVLGPIEESTVAWYAERAAAAVDSIRSRHAIPLFVGGSGLFLRTLLRGLFDGPPADEPLRRRLAAEAGRDGNSSLHARLRLVDPQAADRLHPNDVRRVIRALEVYELTGRPLSDWHRESQPVGPPPRCIWLDGPRDWLHGRINMRTSQMLEAGWPEEVERLLRLDPPPSSVFWTVLGYPEVAAVVRGELSPNEAEAQIATLTRQFAKRQCTWFRNLKECQAVSFDASTDLHGLVVTVAERLAIPIAV